MLPGGSRAIYMIYWHILPGLDLYYADPEQPLTTAGGGELLRGTIVNRTKYCE